VKVSKPVLNEDFEPWELFLSTKNFEASLPKKDNIFLKVNPDLLLNIPQLLSLEYMNLRLTWSLKTCRLLVEFLFNVKSCAFLPAALRLSPLCKALFCVPK
jgi:hypothetical protein